MAIECPARRLFGLQYHPEVVHSKNGVRTLQQFLFKVARIPADWKMSNVLDEEMAKIAAVVRLVLRCSPLDDISHACHTPITALADQDPAACPTLQLPLPQPHSGGS